jgi:hypothetical protein
MDFTIAVHPVEHVVVRGGGEEEGSEGDVVVVMLVAAAGSVGISRSDVLLVVTPLEEWNECFLGCVNFGERNTCRDG